MKRKAQDDMLDKPNGRAEKKRRSINDAAIEEDFRSGLFENAVLQEYKASYASSEP